MKKLLVFSVSILCLSLALAVVLHQFGELAVASSTAPMATEVITDDGLFSLPPGTNTTIPWPTYADGSSATLSECGVIVSSRQNSDAGEFVFGYGGTLSGLTIAHVGGNLVAVGGYLIVCTRNAAGTVAAGQTSWGQIKELYGDE